MMIIMKNDNFLFHNSPTTTSSSSSWIPQHSNNQKHDDPSFFQVNKKSFSLSLTSFSLFVMMMPRFLYSDCLLLLFSVCFHHAYNIILIKETKTHISWIWNLVIINKLFRPMNMGLIRWTFFFLEKNLSKFINQKWTHHTYCFFLISHPKSYAHTWLENKTPPKKFLDFCLYQILWPCA